MPIRIFGVIRDLNDAPFPRLNVQLFAGETPIGQTSSDQLGAYHFSIDLDVLARAFEISRQDVLTVRVTLNRRLVVDSGPVAFDAEEFEINLFADEARPLSEEPRARVSGIVRDALGAPVFGLGIKIVDRDLRSEEELGNTTTGKDGTYVVEYEPTHARRLEKGAPDIVVTALTKDDQSGENDIIVARSEIHFNAARDLKVDLVIDADDVLPIALFDAMTREITPLLGRIEIAELDETARNADLSFIAGDTGFRYVEVAAYVGAHRVVDERDTADLWFAALIGTGFSVEPDVPLVPRQLNEGLRAIATVDSLRLIEIINEAVKNAVIAPVARDRVKSWIEAVTKALGRVLIEPSDLKPSRVGAVLETVGVVESERDKAAVMIERAGVFDDDLEKQLRDQTTLGDAAIEELHALSDTIDLAGGESAVAILAAKSVNLKKREDIRKLAKLSVAEWEKTAIKGVESGLITVEMPLPMIGNNETENVGARILGRTLARRFAAAKPTAVLAGSLSRNDRTNGDGLAQPFKGIEKPEMMAEFLDDHPDLEFNTTPLDGFLEKDVAENWREQAVVPEFRQRLKSIQRVLKLGSSPALGDALLADGVHSASMIYRTGETQFVNKYGDLSAGGRIEAQRVWRQAADTHAGVVSLVAELRAYQKEDLPNALMTDNEALEAFPNWRNLFEGGDVCACDHCRSALSPAAYFADILMFLKDRRTDDDSSDLKNVVFSRRPDLATLELNCSNALTPLPYADVVNEVLEAHIAGGGSDKNLVGLNALSADAQSRDDSVRAALIAAELDPGEDLAVIEARTFGPDQWVAHGSQLVVRLFKKGGPDYVARIAPNTKASASQVRAFPQYSDAHAYATLSAAQRLPALPFDLPNVEVRSAFRKIGCDRAALMRAVRTGRAPHNPTEAEIAAVHLEIAVGARPEPDEFGLIVDQKTEEAHLQAVWGVAGVDWIGRIAVVRRFLDTSELEYNDLLTLLDQSYINPAGALSVTHQDATCDLDKKSINRLEAKALDRMHRFLRLWKKLPGWTMQELNRVITAPSLGGGNIDRDLLIHLSALIRLQAKMSRRATVEALVVFFEPLGTHTEFTEPFEPRRRSFYDSLFQNPRLTRPLDPAFGIDPTTDDLPSGGSIDASRPAIQAATRLSGPDLDKLLAFARPNGALYIPEDTVNLTRLSFLWRHAFVMRELRIPSAEWTTALSMLGGDRESFGTPVAALRLVETLGRMEASVLSIDEMDWILTGNRDAGAADKVDLQEAFLLGLRTELKGVRDAFDSTQYPELTAPSAANIPALTDLFGTLLQALGRPEHEIVYATGFVSGSGLAEAPVANLPADFAFDAVVTDQMPVSLSTDRAALRFLGLMSDPQRQVLLNDATIPAVVRNQPEYQTAVGSLFEAARLAVKFFEPRFDARLSALPSGLSFAALGDPALEARIQYDGRSRRLVATGILTADERDRLIALSVNVDYAAAIATIFDAPRTAMTEWIDVDALEQPMDDPATLSANLAHSIIDALKYLAASRSEALVEIRAAEALDLDADLAARVLAQDRNFAAPLNTLLARDLPQTTGPIDEATFPELVQRWLMARRLATLLSAWQIDPLTFDRLSALTAETQVLDFASLPVLPGDAAASLQAFNQTERLLTIRASVAEEKRLFLDLLVDLKDGVITDPVALGAAAEEIDSRFTTADFELFVGAENVAFPADLYLAETWARLLDSLGFMRALAADAAAARRFAKPGMDATDAKVLRQLLQAKYGEQTWATLGGEIQDVLRNSKREALVAYLLSQPAPVGNPSGKWHTSNDLYGYFLLDVDMSSCMMTSRLVLGANSIQLFVQRCSMGLEPGISTVADGPNGDSAWRWWEWMRKYRVWEANRKVFLFPENWIEPELKPDRSTFFQDLEADLQKNEINRDTVEDAFRAYLEKLEDVSDLQIAAFYQEDDGDNTIVHVFGRSASVEPHLYYYRTFDYRQWSPWQRVDLEITGDYLIPLVVARRLYLFWPVFTEVPDEAANAETSFPEPGPDESMPEVNKRLRVQLAVSDLRQGQWTPKRLSKDYAESRPYTREIWRRRYRFHAIDSSDLDGRVAITFGGHAETASRDPVARLSGTFDISGCSGIPEIGSYVPRLNNAVRVERESVGNDTDFGRWREETRRENSENDFTLVGEVGTMASYFARLLVETPWRFEQRPAWQYSWFDKLLVTADRASGRGSPDGPESSITGMFLPFFYSDRNRTFFAQPFLRQVGSRKKEPIPRESIYYDYNDIKRTLSELVNLLQGFFSQLVAADALPASESDERISYENAVRQIYGIEAAPPYSDELLRNYMVRWLLDLFVRGRFGEEVSRQLQFARWKFSTHYHPFVCDFLRRVNDPLQGIAGLMRREVQLDETPYRFFNSYRPTSSVIDLTGDPENPHSPHYPKEDVDFTPAGAYSPYNWELFYHAPLFIADSLSRNQRFEEARDWYHYIFNPIGVDGPGADGAPTSRYWITKPFYEMTTKDYVAQRIDTIKHLIAGDTNTPGFSKAAKEALEEQVRDWREHPFEPHRIANYRQVAYQKTVVMKYLDNLIRWGDHLFRQDSMESINEATQLYIMAAEILGPRPRVVALAARPVERTFAELETKFDDFSNAMIELENLIPAISPQYGDDAALNFGTAPPIPTLYFCIPRNDKLLGYWDTVGDRLHKIRNCMNIDGVRRALALFEPEIDPGALVKAIAGGGGIAGALADLNAPLPPYRFHVALQQANQLCSDLKSLGSALLVALEKKDAEELALLRQSHEMTLLRAAESIAVVRIQEAREQLAALQKSRESAEFRRDHYDERAFMNRAESTAAKLSKLSILLDIPVSVAYIQAGVLTMIPDFLMGASGFGGSPHASAKTGGQSAGGAAKFAADGLGHIARNFDKIGSLISTTGSYKRRQEDWDLQRDLADHEMTQLDESIQAAELRIDIAQKELGQQRLQTENSTSIDEYMRSKYSNAELYQWQISQISAVYMQSFQLAYDLAKQCERAMQHELARGDSSIVQAGHWDSLKKGLHAGDRLQLDLRRLEAAYNERNKRELELEKRVSLATIDPLALVRLRETGHCEFAIDEHVFDQDWPGHYFRRIKSVSVSVPCIVGPHVSLSCSVRLISNQIRINTLDGESGYPRNTDDAGLPAPDQRFIQNQVPVRSIAISRGIDDSGVFSLDFNDTRYLPFEGAGAVSRWSVELLNDPSNVDLGRPLRQFDYDTISDVVFHIRYTAREDAGPFRAGAIQNLRNRLGKADATPVLRALDLRREFPTEWHRFLFPEDPAVGNVLELPMRRSLFRYLGQGERIKINALWVMARCSDTVDYTVRLSPPLPEMPAGIDSMTLTQLPAYGGLHVAENFPTAAFDVTVGPDDSPHIWKLSMSRAGGASLQSEAATGTSEVEDLLLVIGYRLDNM